MNKDFHVLSVWITFKMFCLCLTCLFLFIRILLSTDKLIPAQTARLKGTEKAKATLIYLQKAVDQLK